MTTNTQYLAEQIAAINSRLNKMRGPQLSYSSLENGSILIRDSSRSNTGYIGIQDDGTTALSVLTGPVPPKPSQLIVNPAIGGLSVRWDGLFPAQPGYISPIAAPWDFLRVEIEVSTDPAFPNVGFGPVAGWITKATGGQVFVPWTSSGATLYVRGRTRSTSGKLSDPGLVTGPLASGYVQLGDLGFNIAQYAGGTTIYYTVSPTTPTPPSWGFTVGDLWLNQIGTATGLSGGPPAGTPLYQTSRWLGASWALVQDQGISNSLAAAIAAQAAADASAKVFRQATAPAWTGAANTAVWYDTSNGELRNIWNGTTWIPSQLGNGAISPNSLIASNVIATGSVVAALLESVMVLATSIVAGTVVGDHSALTSDGLHIFKVLATEGLTEVGRMASSGGIYFGIVDADGNTVAQISDVGDFSGATVSADEFFYQGTALSDLIGQASGAGNGGVPGISQGAQHYYGFAAVPGLPMTIASGTEQPLIEIYTYVDKNRMYWLGGEVQWDKIDDPTQLNIRIRDGGTGAPRLTSPEVYYRQFHAYKIGYDVSAFGMGIRQFTTTGVHRLLLTAEAAAGALHITAPVGIYPNIVCLDLGPAKQFIGSVNTTAPAGASVATHQYSVELSPTSWVSYNGSNVARSDTSDLVQGYDPSGFNGDGGGYWLFTLPSINAGAIDRVDFYVYTNHTYYMSGGTAIWNIISAGGTGWVSNKLRGDFLVGGYPRPGGRSITLPSDWYAFFDNGSPRAVGISAGRSGGTNEIYYCRFAGPSARLRIWYTQ